jgi:hypothetical protein
MAKVADRGFNFDVSNQELNGSQIAGRSIRDARQSHIPTER